MDNFKVPKKVNRHVLKALHILSNGDARKGCSKEQILNQIKFQMRNLVPVSNIDMVTEKCLNNLSDVGLIYRSGRGRFNIVHSSLSSSKANAPKSNKLHKDLFKPSVSRKRNSGQLNPNSRRTQESSLSDDEHDRPRKRMRNNKRLNYAGRSTQLPKARQHQMKNNTSLQFLRKISSYIENSFEGNFNELSNENWYPDLNFPLQPLEKTGTLYENSNIMTHIAAQPAVGADLNVVELFNNSNGFRNCSATNCNSVTNSLNGEPSTKGSVDLSPSTTTQKKSATSVSTSKSQKISAQTMKF